MTEPSMDSIIERLQFCIVDAKTMQLKMLEQVLSIALLQAYEDKAKFEDENDGSAAGRAR